MRSVHSMIDWRYPILAALFLLTPSCAKEQAFRKQTVPVTGRVTVDGQAPSSPVQIRCFNLHGMDQEHPTVSSTVTRDGGQFSISTYESGDGVPEGEYAVTFEWKQLNLVSMSYGGEDALKGRYSDPQTSEVRFTITPGTKPLDLGTIELTTQE